MKSREKLYFHHLLIKYSFKPCSVNVISASTIQTVFCLHNIFSTDITSVWYSRIVLQKHQFKKKRSEAVNSTYGTVLRKFSLKCKASTAARWGWNLIKTNNTNQFNNLRIQALLEKSNLNRKYSSSNQKAATSTRDHAALLITWHRRWARTEVCERRTRKSFARVRYCFEKNQNTIKYSSMCYISVSLFTS